MLIDNAIQLTDRQIDQMLLEEWLNDLVPLWTAFGKTPTSEQLDIYRQALSDIPLGLLEIAVQHTIRNHKFANVPTVGEVWEALVTELNPVSKRYENVQDAIDQWEETRWNSIVYRFGGV